MKDLEAVQKIRGAEAALGIRFCTTSEYTLSLPDSVSQFGMTGQFLFCFADGYQQTVFIWDSKTGIIKPVAYDFSEFLRLIFACGSGLDLARIAMHYTNEYGAADNSSALKKIQEILALTPIQNPGGYINTVGQVIDGSRLNA